MATGNKIELTREMEQISLSNAYAQGVNEKLDLALLAAEAIIIELDPKLNLVCEQWESLNNIEPLVRSLGINDLVVNGRHIDVRVVDQENYVSINKALLGSALLASGSLVVKFENGEASIVAHMTASTWTQLKDQDGSVACKVELEPNFDLVATLKSICKRAQTDQACEKKPTQEELKIFLQSPASSPSLRPLLDALISCSETREQAMQMAEDLPLNMVKDILQKSSAWNSTCDQIAAKLASKFKSVKMPEIKAIVQSLGEKFGGQPEAPEYMNAILTEIVQVELSKKFSTKSQKLKDKVKLLSSKLAQGASIGDSVKLLINNPVAVDLALAIKDTRAHMENFVCATAEEIGAAFQKLALQPVYATHSSENEAGVDSINEALELLEAHEIYEQAEQIKKNGVNF